MHKMGLGRGSDDYKESGPTHLTQICFIFPESIMRIFSISNKVS